MSNRSPKPTTLETSWSQVKTLSTYWIAIDENMRNYSLGNSGDGFEENTKFDDFTDEQTNYAMKISRTQSEILEDLKLKLEIWRRGREYEMDADPFDLDTPYDSLVLSALADLTRVFKL